jgi:hypothetical protein
MAERVTAAPVLLVVLVMRCARHCRVELNGAYSRRAERNFCYLLSFADDCVDDGTNPYSMCGWYVCFAIFLRSIILSPSRCSLLRISSGRIPARLGAWGVLQNLTTLKGSSLSVCIQSLRCELTYLLRLCFICSHLKHFRVSTSLLLLLFTLFSIPDHSYHS